MKTKGILKLRTEKLLSELSILSRLFLINGYGENVSASIEMTDISIVYSLEYNRFRVSRSLYCSDIIKHGSVKVFAENVYLDMTNEIQSFIYKRERVKNEN